MNVREARWSDWDDIWRIFRAVVAGGDTYAYDLDISAGEARREWMGDGKQTFVAVRDGEIVGTYVLKPNQPGLGSHVANAAFMVAPEVQGQGVGTAMGKHALRTAAEAGYRAMQFNLVVSTNEAAVHLWKKLGFSIVGTLPEAFRHREHGYTDAYVMYRCLDDLL